MHSSIQDTTELLFKKRHNFMENIHKLLLSHQIQLYNCRNNIDKVIKLLLKFDPANTSLFACLFYFLVMVFKAMFSTILLLKTGIKGEHIYYTLDDYTLSNIFQPPSFYGRVNIN